MSDPLREYSTVGDKLQLLAKLAVLPVLIPYWLFLHFSQATHLSVANDLKNRIVGYVFKGCPVVQIRSLLGAPKASETMAPLVAEATKKGLVDNNEPLPQDLGFSAQWVNKYPGRKSSDPIILYLHGGGFALTAIKEQLDFINWLAERLLPKRASAVILDYTVTPFKRFPGQLDEAVRCLNYLSTLTDRVILVGDSAGGNLALAILSHQRSPVAGVPPATQQPIFGLALISPWLSLTHKHAGSFVDYTEIDICNAERLDEFGFLYADRKYFNNPVANPSAAPAEYWQGLLPKRTVEVWGEWEVLKDGAKEFAQTAGVPEVFEEKKGLHDCILYGVGSPGQIYVAERIASWL